MGGILPCPKVIFAVSFIHIFPTYSGIGLFFSAKLGQKRQFCARNGTNWHAATRKVRQNTRFAHQNDLFLQLLRYLLLPNLYTHRQESIFVHFVHLDY